MMSVASAAYGSPTLLIAALASDFAHCSSCDATMRAAHAALPLIFSNTCYTTGLGLLWLANLVVEIFILYRQGARVETYMIIDLGLLFLKFIEGTDTKKDLVHR